MSVVFHFSLRLNLLAEVLFLTTNNCDTFDCGYGHDFIPKEYTVRYKLVFIARVEENVTEYFEEATSGVY